MTNNSFIDLISRLAKISGYPHPPERQDKKTIIKCPVCSSVMIKIKSKFGAGYWYGCSGFPACRETMSWKQAKKYLRN